MSSRVRGVSPTTATLPAKATRGRAMLRGHPAGEVRTRQGDGYYRWLDKVDEPRGVLIN